MNPLRRHVDNPRFDDPENHGDLWKAIGACHTRIAVVDERIRVALAFCLLPITGFIVSLQLTLLGLIVGHLVLS